MTDKEKILKALKEGNYEVEIEEPNNVECYTRFDGTPFYVMSGDDAKFGVDVGSCTVYVEDFTFVCELNYGEWSGDDPIEDKDVRDALEGAKGVICGEHIGLDGEWEVYKVANRINEDFDCFWEDDDDRYKDVDSLDGYYEDFPFEYALVEQDGTIGEWVECDTEANCEDLYCIYLDLKENHKEGLESGTDIIIDGEDIRNISEDLYDAMIDAAMEKGQKVLFRATVSLGYFEKVL